MNRFLTRDFLENYIRNHKRSIIKVAIGILIFIAAFFVFCLRDADSKEQISIIAGNEYIAANEEVLSQSQSLSSAAVRSQDESEPEFIYVDIQGAVNNPYVYKLDRGTRVYEAIEKAGGFIDGAQYSDLNLAEILEDQDKIYVHGKDESLNNKLQKSQIVHSNAVSSQASAGKNDLININTATAEELQKISGIGPSTAEKIINFRNENGLFSQIEDLMKVSGIGEKTFEKFKEKITV